MEKRNDYATCHITLWKKSEAREMKKVLHVTTRLRRIGWEFDVLIGGRANVGEKEVWKWFLRRLEIIFDREIKTSSKKKGKK